MIRTSCLAVAICILLLINLSDGASVPLVNINPATDIVQGAPAPSGQFSGFDEPNINGTWGWSFYVKAPITVSAVAWYDENGDGLSHSHRIGLWKDLSGRTTWPYVQTSATFPTTVTNATQLLGTFPPILTEGVVIPSGTAAELDGPWRKTALPAGPIVLSPGGYVLGGLDDVNSTDAIRYGLDHSLPGSPTRMPIDPRVDIGAPGSYDSGFGAPSNFFLLWGVELGPMLFVEPVPEPTTMLMTMWATWFVIGFLPTRRR